MSKKTKTIVIVLAALVIGVMAWGLFTQGPSIIGPTTEETSTK